MTATDGSGATGSATVNINLTNVNEAPAFSGASVARRIGEDAAGGTAVGAPVTATDPDAGDALSYSISGNDAASFSIVASTGQISVATGAALDYQTKPTYSVTVTATDRAGATATVTVNIRLTNVNEAPAFSAASVARTVFHNAEAGDAAGGPVAATDPDGDALTYSLGGADAASFRILAATGQITVAQGTAIAAIDSTYRLTVRASDPSGAAATVSVAVRVVRHVPPDISPPTMQLNNMLCMGFPGCPDSFVFLFPALAVLGVAGTWWKAQRKPPNVYVLFGVWSVSVVATTILVEANPLLALAYILVPAFFGLVWLAFGGVRR